VLVEELELQGAEEALGDAVVEAVADGDCAETADHAATTAPPDARGALSRDRLGCCPTPVLVVQPWLQ